MVSENKETPHTTVLLDPVIKAQARRAGINLSETLREALLIKLSLPKDNKQEVTEKIKEVEAQLNYLKSAEFAAEKLNEEQREKAKRADKESDIKFIQSAFVKKLNGEMKDDQYNKILRAYCLKWNCELVEAVAISQSRN